ncbi:M56 family metallopeptidase [Hoylesella shahii]|uniref:TonB family protein n=1 Tax=Hoylesella shahii DSM 15611 = JCM 12083 TaxID=1122991 RepID=A0A318HY67_9BACT|nr:M56 family metallopeptidase [Hoylesella shahii]PXX18902.1 TonB family protein [Hoylesella shahii DSM 15611 = JCM 12083]
MYLIKANVVLVVLFVFYQIISAGDTFFKWRRLSLLTVYMLSLLLPTIDLSVLVNETVPLGNILPRMAYNLPEVMVQPTHDNFDWQQLAVWLYTGVALALLLRVFWQVGVVCRLAQRSERATLHGTAVCLLTGDYSPFSFFRWIFVNPVNKTPSQVQQILTHEQTHVAQWHSADALLSQLFVAVFWFNPVAWLMRLQVRNNLEYLADRSVINGGTDKKAYQYHLLAVAYRTNVATITNNFNVLPLKKRIKMMNKQTSNPLARFKYLLFVPLAVALLAMNNTTIRANVQKKVVKTTKTTKKADASNKVYEVCEQMPTFPGGDAALMKYLSENVKYPALAIKAQEQGRVVVSFTVEKDGAISDVKVARSVTPSLDAEAVRVVKAMPKWTPGKQGGQLVRVRYNVPVSFKLN